MTEITPEGLRQIGFVPYDDQGRWAYFKPGRTVPSILIRLNPNILTLRNENNMSALPVNSIENVKYWMISVGLKSEESDI